MIRRPLGGAAAVLWLASHAAVSAGPATPAPPLPRAANHVVRVTTEPALQTAVATATNGTTILIAPGVYKLTRPLILRGLSRVALRGDSDTRDAVVLMGRGMANPDHGGVLYGIWAGDKVEDLLIANLTLRDYYFHPIIFNAGVTRPHVYNVHLIDAGQQFLKSNPDAAGRGNDGGIVEYSVFEFTTTGRDDYPKAIDLHGARGWIIRHNLFRNIRAPGSLLNGPAVLAWRGSRDTIVESNTFVDCQREIVIGAEETTPDSHAGGIVRNNFIARRPGLIGDAAISVWDSPGTLVAHNTILVSGTYRHAIDIRFPGSTRVEVLNNLTDADVLVRNRADARLDGNVTTATAGDFVDAPRGDLHLTRASRVALRRGVALQPSADWDGQRRPAVSPDAGADQTDAAGVQ